MGRIIQIGDRVWVDLTGLDFTLIRVELLEKISDPWFKTGPSLTNRNSVALEPYISSEKYSDAYGRYVVLSKGKKVSSKNGCAYGSPCVTYGCKIGECILRGIECYSDVQTEEQVKEAEERR